ncbi:nuclear transport factor 2 family protein [Pseudoduganella namucuonensis]|uniref:SnoaL-like domain-containing protein n=1 Tax=Pseudoduganella namucuonensis TaxID=1035707 RepID=A0A1I7LDX2_9BURK|nr:nuclear transport factor 2 family protein [Pseudoduganella namucuonensis]SFV07883.1 SnoaL-like domain-containing protein [Pseudoduganella namucuonensis]
MIDLEAYERYVAKFNARDYEGVLSHFAEDFEIRFAGHTFRGRKDFMRFYGFFHDHVSESIRLDALASSDTLLAIEASVRLEAKSDLTPAMLAEQGLERIFPLRAGQVVEMNQFIHYRLENGKFVSVVCALV